MKKYYKKIRNMRNFGLILAQLHSIHSRKAKKIKKKNCNALLSWLTNRKNLQHKKIYYQSEPRS